jgi:hypothetical protein
LREIAVRKHAAIAQHCRSVPAVPLGELDDDERQALTESGSNSDRVGEAVALLRTRPALRRFVVAGGEPWSKPGSLK